METSRGTNEWGTLSWGLDSFQNCVISPVVVEQISEEGELILLTQLTNGQIAFIGMEIFPALNWQGSLNGFCEQFEENAPQLVLEHQLNFQGSAVLRISEPQIRLDNPRGPAKLMRRKEGILIYSQSSIRISNEFIGLPLAMTIRLNLNLKEDCPFPAKHVLMDSEEKQVRQKLELNRFRGSRVPSREVSTTVKFCNPAVVSFVIKELQGLSTLLTVHVENTSDLRTIVVENIAVQIGLTCRCIIDSTNSESRNEFMGSANNADYQQLLECPFTVQEIRSSSSESSSAASIFPGERYSFAFLLSCVGKKGDWGCVVGDFLTPVALRMIAHKDGSRDSPPVAAAVGETVDISEVFYFPWTMGTNALSRIKVSGAEDDRLGLRTSATLDSLVTTSNASASGFSAAVSESKQVLNIPSQKFSVIEEARNNVQSISNSFLLATQTNQLPARGFSLAATAFPLIQTNGDVNERAFNSCFVQINRPFVLMLEITNLLPKVLRNVAVGRDSSTINQGLLLVNSMQRISDIPPGATVAIELYLLPLLAGRWKLDDLVVFETKSSSSFRNANKSTSGSSSIPVKNTTNIAHRIWHAVEVVVT